MTQKSEEQFHGHILVAEDYPVNQELIREMLEMMGCTADVAENGVIALDLYNTNDYDMILMDIQMPEKDGYIVTEEIRAIEKKSNRKRTPIVALTASAFEETKNRCFAVGMDDFISKPLKFAELEEMLRKFIG